MKWYYILATLFYGFMIWCMADAMFDCAFQGKNELAALNLIGVIAWTGVLMDRKNDFIKEMKEEEKKKEKKNLDITKK